MPLPKNSTVAEQSFVSGFFLNAAESCPPATDPLQLTKQCTLMRGRFSVAESFYNAVGIFQSCRKEPAIQRIAKKHIRMVRIALAINPAYLLTGQT